MADHITITAECLCKKHKFSIDIPKSKLPLESGICHCDSCRHSTGALTVVETTWPQPKEQVDISALKTYQFSPNIDYRFCETCSSLMFYESKKLPSKLGVFIGVLSNNDANVIKFTEHIYVEDTKDGGASIWLRTPNTDGKEIPRYLLRDGESDEIPWSWPDHATGSSTGQREPLPLWCHCKGIQLHLHPGDYVETEADKLPWFIDPRNRKRLASHDVCDSCRYQFGNDIVNWTFADFTDITQTDGQPFASDMWKLKDAVDKGDSAVGTLAYYQSSPDVLRFFCKTCCASVFYACEDRGHVADIAVGMIEAPEGARAENYLSWEYGESPSWSDDVKGGWRQDLIKSVTENAKKHRAEMNYPKSFRKLAKAKDEAES